MSGTVVQEAIAPPPSAAAGPDARSLGPAVFGAVAVASLGGPLALAALYAPLAIADVPSSAGLVAVAAPLLFALPLLVWLRYARHVAGPGGLYGYVEAGAGRKVALVQAGLWTTSYLLYLLYTTTYVVYDLLPAVLGHGGSYQPVLQLTLPVLLAAVVLAPRALSLGVVGALAAGQLALAGLLDVVAVQHTGTAAAFTPHAAPGALAPATAAVALLFICGSLPLFLGGEVVRPTRTVGRVLPVAVVATALVVVLAVLPYATDPAFTRDPLPGQALVGVDVGHVAGVAVGLGVVGSVLGVVLVEYLALTRLLHAVTGRGVRTTAGWLAVPLVLAGPVSLLDPERFYDDLLRPSLVTLWLSQLLVVAAFPAFAARRHGRRVRDLALAAGAGGVVLWGLVDAVTSSGGT